MKDFFVSYNRADRSWAEWIAWQLEAAGHTLIIQAWDFREGGNFVLDMQRAVDDAERTVVVLSPDFLASQFTAPEWAAAFARDPAGLRGLLLPVRVRECRPTGLLAQLVYVDLVGVKNRDEARQRLLKGAAEGRAKPRDEPGMPAPDPGSSGPLAPTVTAPEPPWPPSLQVAARLAGSVFWRVARVGLLTLAAGLAVLGFLRGAMPLWFDAKPGAVYSVSLLWGLLAALLVEGALLLWRRRRARATAAPGSA